MAKISNAQRLEERRIRLEEQAKARKRALIVTLSAILGVILLITLILSIVKPNAHVDIYNDDVSTMQVIFTGGYDYGAGRDGSTLELSSKHDVRKNEYEKFVAAYVDATDYSVGYAILDNKWFPSMNLSKNADNEYLKIKPTNIDTFAGSATSPLIVVKFDKLQSVKIEDIEIEYNFIYYVVTDSANQLVEFKMYFVNLNKYKSNNIEDVQTYFTYEVNMTGNLSTIFNAINEIKAAK